MDSELSQTIIIKDYSQCCNYKHNCQVYLNNHVKVLVQEVAHHMAHKGQHCSRKGNLAWKRSSTCCVKDILASVMTPPKYCQLTVRKLEKMGLPKLRLTTMPSLSSIVVEQRVTVLIKCLGRSISDIVTFSGIGWTELSFDRNSILQICVSNGYHSILKSQIHSTVRAVS